jgi:hypothetical protein
VLKKHANGNSKQLNRNAKEWQKIKLFQNAYSNEKLDFSKARKVRTG